MLSYPALHADDPRVNRAYRIAMGDLVGNVQPFQDGLLETPQPVILAGLDYETPWTRDAAINVWNGLGLFWPDVARNTLLSVLEVREGKVRIGGQYWDAMIWILGAWSYYLYTGDRPFLSLAFEAVCNSIERFEAEEYNPQIGLFRGPAVYGDGVSAYPDRYSPGGTSSILDWVVHNPHKKAPRGYGLPMMSLSTNCIYYQAYRIANEMAEELAAPTVYASRAEILRKKILQNFWIPELGTFRYLVDGEGGCDHQEGLGHSFALLFDIANEDQAQSILRKQKITPAGIPCVWPSYERYLQKGGYGRHGGTVWPFISAFWGQAALKHGSPDLFEQEFGTFTENINRHGQCAEIYHSLTGAVYGGLQEAGSGSEGLEWVSCSRQSWTASAYLRMILLGITGMHFERTGIRFAPFLPKGMGKIRISSLPYRRARLHIELEGSGMVTHSFKLNGIPHPPDLPADLHGDQQITIELRE